MSVPVEPPLGVTCYSGGEGDFMRRWQTLRGRLLAQLLAALARVRVTTNCLRSSAGAPPFGWTGQGGYLRDGSERAGHPLCVAGPAAPAGLCLDSGVVYLWRRSLDP